MAAVGLKSWILDNNLKSALLLAGFPVLLVLIVFALDLALVGAGWTRTSGSLADGLGHAAGMMLVSLPLAVLGSALWFAVAFQANRALIAGVVHARPVARADAPEIYNLLENLCISRGVRTPALYLIDDPSLNAFASGMRPGQYAVTVTRGLLEALDEAELEAVLGHELTHIMNRDTRLMVICAVFAGVITFVAEMLLRGFQYAPRGRRSERDRGGGVLILAAMGLAALGYGLAVVLRFALSRNREFLADAGSVELTKNPDAMISALRKIQGRADLAAPEQVRPLFFENRATGFSALMATHPPIEQRIEALVRYAGGAEGPGDAARSLAPSSRQPPGFSTSSGRKRAL